MNRSLLIAFRCHPSLTTTMEIGDGEDQGAEEAEEHTINRE